MESIRLHKWRVKRFLRYIDKGGPNGCWLWVGPSSCMNTLQMQRDQPNWKRSIYGRYARSYAHRFAYEVFVGPIPTGLTIDHACFNTLCVNPDHLEAVPQAENSRRFMVKRLWPNKPHTNGNAVLAARALQLMADGHTQTQAAALLGYSQSHVSKVIKAEARRAS